MLYRAYLTDRQVLMIGNGGSSSTASHMAVDVGKAAAAHGGRRLRVISLAENPAMVTAIANDCGYENVFVEQLKSLLRPGDVLVALSASGNSNNILRAIDLARSKGAQVVALLGFSGGAAAALADVAIVVPSDDYGVIENVHMVINHIITDYLRSRVAEGGGGRVSASVAWDASARVEPPTAAR